MKIVCTIDGIIFVTAPPDIVKISDEDLDWIAPKNVPVEEKIAALHQKGAILVILTKCSAGASAHAIGSGAVNVAAPKVTVADTVGEGDTFNAGFLAQLSNTGLLNIEKIAKLSAVELTAALKYAAKVAAITVSRSGANPPYLAEL